MKAQILVGSAVVVVVALASSACTADPTGGDRARSSASSPHPTSTLPDPVGTASSPSSAAPLPDVGASSPPPLPGAETIPGRFSAVTGTAPAATLTALAQMADVAVQRVSSAWPSSWPKKLTLIAPRDVADFRRLSGRSEEADQVAAITDGPLGGDGRATGDRILINPRAFAALTAEGRQFVITHEAVHVAQRASVPGAPPLWLAEGFADHVGYSGSRRGRVELADSLLDAVATNAGPRRLPTLADFDPAQGQIAPAYLASWLAVDLIGRRHGETRLRAFVRACTVVGSPADADAACDRAFGTVLGTSRERFTRAWLSELRALARERR